VDEERLNRLVFTVGLEKELNSSEDLTDVTISFDGQAAIDFTEFKDKGMSLEQIRDELKQPMRQRQFSTLLQNAREVTISGIQGKTLKFTLDSPPYFDFGVILTEQRRWLTLRMTTYRGSDVGGESSVSAGTANWTLQVE
jgi:hypothetical protein